MIKLFFSTAFSQLISIAAYVIFLWLATESEIAEYNVIIGFLAIISTFISLKSEKNLYKAKSEDASVIAIQAFIVVCLITSILALLSDFILPQSLSTQSKTLLLLGCLLLGAQSLAIHLAMSREQIKVVIGNKLIQSSSYITMIVIIFHSGSKHFALAKLAELLFSTVYLFAKVPRISLNLSNKKIWTTFYSTIQSSFKICLADFLFMFNSQIGFYLIVYVYSDNVFAYTTSLRAWAIPFSLFMSVMQEWIFLKLQKTSSSTIASRITYNILALIALCISLNILLELITYFFTMEFIPSKFSPIVEIAAPITVIILSNSIFSLYSTIAPKSDRLNLVLLIISIIMLFRFILLAFCLSAYEFRNALNIYACLSLLAAILFAITSNKIENKPVNQN